MSDKGREELQDPNIRRALTLGLDRDIIVEQVLQGGQRPAYNWTHWAMEGFEMPEIEMASMSQEDRVAEAKRLLEEAGFGPDNPLNLTLNYNTSEDHKKIAVVAQQMWKPLGVNLTLNNMEWKVHTDRMQEQDFELARYAWCADYNEASTFLDYFRSTGSNYGEFNNADYDALLDEAVTSENPNEQYTQAEQILAQELPLIPIYHYAQVDSQAVAKGLPFDNVMNSWYGKECISPPTKASPYRGPGRGGPVPVASHRFSRHALGHPIGTRECSDIFCDGSLLPSRPCYC